MARTLERAARGRRDDRAELARARRDNPSHALPEGGPGLEHSAHGRRGESLSHDQVHQPVGHDDLPHHRRARRRRPPPAAARGRAPAARARPAPGGDLEAIAQLAVDLHHHRHGLALEEGRVGLGPRLLPQRLPPSASHSSARDVRGERRRAATRGLGRVAQRRLAGSSGVARPRPRPWWPVDQLLDGRDGRVEREALADVAASPCAIVASALRTSSSAAGSSSSASAIRARPARGPGATSADQRARAGRGSAAAPRRRGRSTRCRRPRGP